MSTPKPDVIAVDIEHLGWKRDQEIIDVGLAWNYDGGIDTWGTRIRPLRPDLANQMSVDINGFNEAEWAGEPLLSEVIVHIYRLIQGVTLVGHNIRSCDIPKLKIALEVSGFPWKSLGEGNIDTLSLAKRFLKQKLPDLKLNTLCAYFDIPLEGEVHYGVEGAKRHLLIYRAFQERGLTP
jgi:DNA polymerase III epsilon subunit-like protein